VANRKDVWYVANGWLYSYRYVAENVIAAGPAKCGN
jgi:S-adenosylmethionine synthetase